MVQGHDSRDDSDCFARVYRVLGEEDWTAPQVMSRLSYPQGLQLARAKLSHEKQVAEAQERVAQLEARLKHLESEAGNASVERMAPEGSPTKKSWW
jgi:hypothetical protein